jgi:localization factor PodJL
MPSSDRFEGEDRRVSGGAAPVAGARQKFDPNEPWDAQSAEALTRLYETLEGDPRKDPYGTLAHRTRRRPRKIAAAAPAPATAAPVWQQDREWLEARLSDIASQLQRSLAALDPDKTLAPLTQRIDQIEQRFSEALAGVAQRSDFDGLRLIEAHVMEFAGHLEQTRSRLDQIGSIDDQLRHIASRLDEGDHRRLDALETLFKDYVADWRRSEARTTSALSTLEETVARMGDTIEAIEATKPAADLSLSILGAADQDADAARIASDPLSQVYAEGARALGPKCYRSPLDAADYAPKPSVDFLPLQEIAPLPEPTTAPSFEAAPMHASTTEQSAIPLRPPALRASTIRAKVRQAQLLNDGTEALPSGERPPKLSSPSPLPLRDPPQSSAAKHSRPGVLLAAGATLFAAIGYLLVDTFLGATPVPAQRTGMSAPAAPKSARTEAMLLPPDTTVAKQEDIAPAVPPPTSRDPALDIEDASLKLPGEPKLPMVDGHGGAIVAHFLSQGGESSQPKTNDAKHSEGAAPGDTPASAAAPPAIIGPASLRQAAMAGDPAAQFQIAARFAAGQGVSKDLAQALLWYGRAAAKGYARAQFRLAVMHERGLGTTADVERARVWYARAAAQGHVKAMHNLAVLSISGGRSDYDTAAKWFELAAEHGLSDSQFNLAVLQQSGLGTPKDLHKAYRWLTLAGRGGDTEAANRAIQVKSQLPAAGAAAAEAAAAAWRPRQADPEVNEPAPGT